MKSIYLYKFCVAQREGKERETPCEHFWIMQIHRSFVHILENFFSNHLINFWSRILRKVGADFRFLKYAMIFRWTNLTSNFSIDLVTSVYIFPSSSPPVFLMNRNYFWSLVFASIYSHPFSSLFHFVQPSYNTHQPRGINI